MKLDPKRNIAIALIGIYTGAYISVAGFTAWFILTIFALLFAMIFYYVEKYFF